MLNKQRASRGRMTERRRGFALVWVAVLLIVLLGLVGLATDTAVYNLAAQQLQNASDAASLAAVRHVRGDHEQARLAAVALAGANDAGRASVQLRANAENLPEGDVVLGRYTRATGQFIATTESPNAVRVVSRRTSDSLGGELPLVFGAMFGIHTANVERAAIAMIGGGSGAGLIALNPSDDRSLYVYGNARLRVNDGDIQVNSSHARQAARFQGNVTVVAPAINIHGDYQSTGGVDVQGEVHTGAETIDDPLAFLEPENDSPVLPSYVDYASITDVDKGAITSSGSYEPGYYAGGISLNGGANVYLSPGVYVLDGAGLRVGANTIFHGDDVMLYIIGSGTVRINGTPDMTVTPLNDGSDYTGISIFQARSNGNEALLNGTALLDLQGTIYLPRAKLTALGTGDGFGNQLIVDKLDVGGTADVIINYQGPIPAVGNQTFLVR